MRIAFYPSFYRSIKNLPVQEKEDIQAVLKQTLDILAQDKFVHVGLGLKRLKEDYWEVRKGLKTRIIFRWRGDLVELFLAGDHDDVRRFLKSI